jgi:hypothetical protein
MEAVAARRHPVLHYLAVVRAARDFGLGPHDLDSLTLRFPPDPGSIEKLSEAVAASLLGRRYTSQPK